MADAIKHDTLSEVSTMGSRALIGGILTVVAVTAAVATGGYFGGSALVEAIATNTGNTALGAWSGLAGTAGAAIGGLLSFVYTSTACAVTGGLFGALSGAQKCNEESTAYYNKVRKHAASRQEALAQNNQDVQTNVMVGYQQGLADAQAQLAPQLEAVVEQARMQGRQEGAQLVVQHIQEQQGKVEALKKQAAAEPKKGFADKECKPCATKADQVMVDKAAAAQAPVLGA